PLCDSNWLRDWFPNTTHRPSVDEPPPAYDEIVKTNPSFSPDLKKSSAVTAAADALADQKCVEVYDVTTEAESSSTVTQGKAAEQQRKQKLEFRLGKKSLTREQQEFLRLKRGKNLEKRDLGLYLFYIPIFTIAIAYFCGKSLPDLVANGSAFVASLRSGSGSVVTV
ncbi:hypothetical protein LTS18_007377, partial [Coniosporium uncinatum]